jgi:protease-4
VGAGLAGLFSVSIARADPFPTAAEHVPAPGRSIVSDETSEAIVLNPANLGWLPAPELRWSFVLCPDRAITTGCGNAFGLATPLLFGLATGLRVDWMRPPWGAAPSDGVGFPYRGFDYVWLTWALAAKLTENLAVGFSLDHSYSQNPYLSGLNGITAAASWRPYPVFGFSAVARDFNRPSSTIVPAIAHPFVEDSLPILDGRFAFGMAFRPTGRRDVELGLEVQYWEALQGHDQWTDRATLGFDVPSLGRVFGEVDIAHLPNDTRRAVVGTAGIELHFLGLSAGGGAIFGNGLGPDEPVAEYGSVAVAGYTQPGIPRPRRTVWIRIEHTPSTRGHVALLRQLWSLAHARDIAAVTLIVRDEPASSFAHAEELADAIRFLRAYGKRVLVSLEDAGAKALYISASADRVVLTPAGGIRYAGLKSQYIYLKGLLDKIGVRGDFVRIGPHKTAPEQFTNEHAGPVANEDHIDMLRQQEAVFVRNLSLYRHMPEERVREVTRHGPFFASEARDAGFVDAFAFDDELERATRELVGSSGIGYGEYQPETKAERVFGPRRKIAIIYLDGDIVDGRSQHIPLIDMRLVGSYSMADTIREVHGDASVRAVVLRIESPGGSSLASDVMWRELSLLAKDKPLIVSMGTVAASGGYYVASASHDIFALPLTITGSIGVFYGKADVSGLLDKIGVTVDTYKTAPRADAESFFRGFTPDEEKELTHKVEQFYDVFLDRVSEGRRMSKQDIDAVGRGRVWTGQQAFDRHLVDHLGGLRQAIDAARDAAALPPDTPIEEMPPENETLVQKAIAALTGGSDRAEVSLQALPPAVRAVGRAVAPLVVYRSDEPLARMEWVDAGDWIESESR